MCGHVFALKRRRNPFDSDKSGHFSKTKFSLDYFSILCQTLLNESAPYTIIVIKFYFINFIWNKIFNFRRGVHISLYSDRVNCFGVFMKNIIKNIWYFIVKFRVPLLIVGVPLLALVTVYLTLKGI